MVLNDNNMSIDQATGGLHDYLLRVTSSNLYNKVKGQIWNRLGEGKLRDWVQRRVMDTKSNLVRESGGAIFESLGFRYFGPIDGNDIAQVTDTLRRLRDLKGPRILHVITRKGKGYAPAEADPTTWHAPGRFDPVTGEQQKTVYPAARYQDVFGATLVELARLDHRTDAVGVDQLGVAEGRRRDAGDGDGLRDASPGARLPRAFLRRGHRGRARRHLLRRPRRRRNETLLQHLLLVRPAGLRRDRS